MVIQFPSGLAGYRFLPRCLPGWIILCFPMEKKKVAIRSIRMATWRARVWYVKNKEKWGNGVYADVKPCRLLVNVIDGQCFGAGFPKDF